MKNRILIPFIIISTTIIVGLRTGDIIRQLTITLNGAEVKKCPKCGGRLLKVVYGMFAGEKFEDIGYYYVIPGGCCINSDSHDRECVDCNYYTNLY